MVYSDYISSIENQHIKHLKKIMDSPKKYRNYIVVEGEKHIKEFSNNTFFTPLRFFVIEGKENKFQYLFSSYNCFIITERVLDYLSDVDSSQGIIGLFEVNYDMMNYDNIDESNETFIFDTIGDPGNFGTLIRTAAALGKKSIICIGGVFPFSQKVIRSSAGMIAHVRIFYFFEYDEHCKNSLMHKQIIILDMDGADINCSSYGEYKNYSIVLGSEGQGIHSFWNKNFKKIALPMDSRVESLNVAVVGSVVGYLLWGVKV